MYFKLYKISESLTLQMGLNGHEMLDKSKAALEMRPLGPLVG